MLLAPAAVATDLQQTVETKFIPSGLIPGSRFGEALAFDGDTMAVGAPDHYVPADALGRVYILLREGSGWSEQSQLLAADGHAGDEFGASVALEGDTLFVGAPSYTGKSGQFEGGAYVFARDGAGIWTQQLKLLPEGVGAPDRFGEQVALAGDLAVVLSERATTSGFHVFPYARDAGGQWIPEPPIDPGFAVQEIALSGTTLVAAGMLPDENAGAAVYNRDGGAWVLETILAGEVALTVHVGCDGQTLALASLCFWPPKMNVFRRQPGGGWAEQEIVLPDLAGMAGLGVGIAGAGDRLAASLLNNGTDEFDAVLLFGLDEQDIWQEEVMLVPPGFPIDNGFGTGLALEGATLAIGAAEDSEAGASAGAIFIAELPGPECPWDLDASQAVGTADLLALLAQWGADPGGPPDFDGDGAVGAADLLALLANWGPCPP